MKKKIKKTVKGLLYSSFMVSYIYLALAKKTLKNM